MCSSNCLCGLFTASLPRRGYATAKLRFPSANRAIPTPFWRSITPSTMNNCARASHAYHNFCITPLLPLTLAKTQTTLGSSRTIRRGQRRSYKWTLISEYRSSEIEVMSSSSTCTCQEEHAKSYMGEHPEIPSHYGDNTHRCIASMGVIFLRIAPFSVVALSLWPAHCGASALGGVAYGHQRVSRVTGQSKP